MVEYEEVIMMTEETSIPIAKFSFEIFNKIKVAESLNDVDLSGLHHKEIIQLETIMTTDKSKCFFSKFNN